MKKICSIYIPIALLVLMISIGFGWKLTTSDIDILLDHKKGFLATGSAILTENLSQPIRHLKGLIQEPQINRALHAREDIARGVLPHEGRDLQALSNL